VQARKKTTAARKQEKPATAAMRNITKRPDPMSGSTKSAAILGASGNCGRALVKVLSASPDWSSITVISRRKLDEFDAIPKVKQEIVRMDKDEDFEEDLNKVFTEKKHVPDACFVTMGIGKPKTVTAEELERVDCNLPTIFAKAASGVGVKHACLLSAVGSDIDSKPSKLISAVGGSAWGAYAHVKGQVEKNVCDEPFTSVTLVRPAGLLGNANTPTQGLLRGTSFLMPTKYKPIEIVDLAHTMSAQALAALDYPKAEARPTILEGTSLFSWVDKAKSK